MGKCDCLISIDADLQDDVNAMRAFLEEYLKGADVVYGVRSRRDTDSAFKRLTAEGFYKLMSLLGAETVYNHADYRLLSARALEALLSYPEVNLYLRGLVPLLGFETAKVYYERRERTAGESKYPLKKMLALAFQGATSFSVKPLSLIWKTGLLSAFLSVLIGLIYLILPAEGPGFAAFSIWFVGGLILAAWWANTPARSTRRSSVARGTRCGRRKTAEAAPWAGLTKPRGTGIISAVVKVCA